MKLEAGSQAEQTEHGWKDTDGFISPFLPGIGPRSNPQGEFPTGPELGNPMPHVQCVDLFGNSFGLHEVRAGRPFSYFSAQRCGDHPGFSRRLRDYLHDAVRSGIKGHLYAAPAPVGNVPVELVLDEDPQIVARTVVKPESKSLTLGGNGELVRSMNGRKHFERTAQRRQISDINKILP